MILFGIFIWLVEGLINQFVIKNSSSHVIVLKMDTFSKPTLQANLAIFGYLYTIWLRHILVYQNKFWPLYSSFYIMSVKWSCMFSFNLFGKVLESCMVCQLSKSKQDYMWGVKLIPNAQNDTCVILCVGYQLYPPKLASSAPPSTSPALNWHYQNINANQNFAYNNCQLSWTWIWRDQHHISQIPWNFKKVINCFTSYFFTFTYDLLLKQLTARIEIMMVSIWHPGEPSVIASVDTQRVKSSSWWLVSVYKHQLVTNWAPTGSFDSLGRVT